ncbi:MAG: alpha-hydroxy acid oxidase, partial [Caulobacteraceae bacterium]
AFVQKESGLPVILKGVLTPELARRAVAAGVAAVQVSNHGGRQTDGLPAALDALPDVVKAVGGRVPVVMDGGIRRGVDVFKALALGAKAVAIGRPALYGLALGGPLGVQSVYDRLRLELIATMQAAGVDRIDQIDGKYVRRIA